MKIKTKKQLNLPQLIDWAMKNEKFGKTFISNNYNCVHVTDDGIIEFTGTFYGDTFTVEEEIEITEDVHLDYLYVLTDAKDVHRCTNFTINTASKAIERNDLTFFTLVDNDLVKICDKGKLVE
ncbi:Uncharacterised protein [Staphylococcus xylosus]|uniref:hypothetical protein n=1 Tax=Staphylococcus xylosus TaxID=1288 RepID=UPI00085CD72C|nr:hypothetical protein [Staphylococcus xylosus]SCU31536.1 Uncharacterised protein [Staphylococcus xylosus]